MYLFNTTFSVEKETINQWREWMDKNYLPTFKDLLPMVHYELYELMTAVKENSVNFSCQWRCKTPDELEVLNKYSTILLNNMGEQLGEKCLSFSSILKLMERE
jgi:hypothetical protein